MVIGMITPPIPCTTRKATSAGSEPARPHRSDPARNAPTASSHALRAPSRSQAHPLTGITATYASR